MRASLLCLLALIVAMQPSSPCARSGPNIYHLTQDGSRCTEALSQDVLNIIQSAVKWRKDKVYKKWVYENWRPSSEFMAKKYKMPVEQLDLSNDFQMAFYDSGIDYLFDAGRIHCEIKRSIFEYYSSSMAYYDAKGKCAWKKKVPYYLLPVFPFVTNAGVLYIGEEKDESFLFMYELKSGKLLERIKLPKLRYQLANPEESLPVYKDGFAIIQGCSEKEESGSVGEILVIDLRAEREK